MIAAPPPLSYRLTKACSHFQVPSKSLPFTFRCTPYVSAFIYKIFGENIHLSAIFHSLCNIIGILFAVLNRVKLHITFLVI